MAHKEVIDIVSAVKELHRFSPHQLNKLLRDSDGFVIRLVCEKGGHKQMDMEKLSRFLPLHLLAVIMSSNRDAAQFTYVLCGFRLLCSLCNLAPRQSKLEKILLDDVRIADQLLDLVIYTLIVLSGHRQGVLVSSEVQILHSALVTCSLHLLSQCISSKWQDLVHVLLAHPKVDIFLDASFGAVCMNVRSLHLKLSHKDTVFDQISDAYTLSLFQHCESSLNFLHSLCQQKSFRECLVRNKELPGKGGILFLARSILKLGFPSSYTQFSPVLAVVSRLKSTILSIILHLCEAECLSYLDEVASSLESMELAKSVTLEVLELIKAFTVRCSKSTDLCFRECYASGLLQVNALRLVDVFSDDSNFRSFITLNFTELIASIFLLPHGEFLCSWCSSESSSSPSREEYSVLAFDPFSCAGCVLDSLLPSPPPSHSEPPPPQLPPSSAANNSTTRSSYGHQRTSLLVKVIANLHCFISDVCKEQERNLFLHKFIRFLERDRTTPSSSSGYLFRPDDLKASTVCRNLCSLLGHAESLIPNFLIEDDVQLLRVFLNQIESLISPDFDNNNLLLFQESGMNEEGEKAKGMVEGTSENNIVVEEGAQVSTPTAWIGWSGAVEEQQQQVIRCPVEIERDVRNTVSTGSDSSINKGNTQQVFARAEETRHHHHHHHRQQHRHHHGIHKGKAAVTAAAPPPAAAVAPEKPVRKKRKRTIMNDKQIKLMEAALLDEPEMQRNAMLLHYWSATLTSYGSEITPSQLKNWLNNRKAKLARVAKDVMRSQQLLLQQQQQFIGRNVDISDDVSTHNSVGEFYAAPSSGHQPICPPPHFSIKCPSS